MNSLPIYLVVSLNSRRINISSSLPNKIIIIRGDRRGLNNAIEIVEKII